MSITLDLPVEVENQLLDMAEQCGSTEAAVTQLIRQHKGECQANKTPSVAPAKDPNDLSREEWKAHMAALRALAKPRGTNVDYSRESFYPETVW